MKLPRTFRSLAVLRFLNIAAVGASLAAITAVVFGKLLSAAYESELMAAVALATAFYGVLWAALLRTRARFGRTGLRWGWLASIPLAAANGGTACGLLFWIQGAFALREFLIGSALGATVGAICWVPALLATLACFGGPIAWAQKQASKGLAGEESGEFIVGLVSAGISALALVLETDLQVFVSMPLHSGNALAGMFALVGLAAGGSAAVFARRREDARRAFVREVEAGGVKGYRVDVTEEGKVLIEVTGAGEGYRVANFEVPVFALGEEGEAQRSLELGRAHGR